MLGRRRRFAAFAVAGGTMALLATSGPANSMQSGPAKAVPHELPKAIRVDPVTMQPLPIAVIDDTLALGGEDINAKKVRSRMTVAVKINGAGPYNFVVDSGADSSVIGRSVATELQLPVLDPITVNGMTGASIVPRVEVKELGLGPTGRTFLELPVLEEHDMGGDGMLGIDALADERLMMDFEKRTITVEDSSKPEEKWDGDIIVVTARRRRGQLILTEVKVNGQKVDAVVDTGTEITIGNSALREILRGHRMKLEKGEIRGVTGEVLPIELLRIGEIKLGSVVLRNVPIAFADVPPFKVFGLSKQPSLLLGTDLMETFRRISLDFHSRKVRFQLRRCKDQRITLSTASAGADSLTRLGVVPGGEEACRR